MSKHSTRRAAVVLGASSGVGRALAEELAEQGTDLLLVARDARDLHSLAHHLNLVHGVRVLIDPMDLANSSQNFSERVGQWMELLGGFQTLLVPAGQIDDDDGDLPGPLSLDNMIRVNFLNIAQVVTACARQFSKRGRGQIIGFSSIAAAVPRGRNMAYAAAKAGLETYLRALRHHLAGRHVVVQVVSLGYVDSAMTFGRRLLFPVTNPHQVAARVVRTMKKDIGLVYYPRFWWLVTRLLQWLPWRIYRLLRF